LINDLPRAFHSPQLYAFFFFFEATLQPAINAASFMVKPADKICGSSHEKLSLRVPLTGCLSILLLLVVGPNGFGRNCQGPEQTRMQPFMHAHHAVSHDHDDAARILFSDTELIFHISREAAVSSG
jgi:hypothetical protein